MAAGAGAIRAGLAVVEIGGDTGPLKAALGTAADMLSGYATSVAKLGATMAAAGAAITAPLTGLFKEAVGGAKDAGALASQLGLTAEKASALQYAFGGGEEAAGKLSQIARKLNSQLASAAEGNAGAIDSFLKLGLSWEELSRMPFDERLATIGGEISNLKDDFHRTDQAVQFFGRTGVDTLKNFAKGAQGLRDKMAEAGEIGAVITTEQAAQGRAIGKAWGVMSNSVKFAFLEVGRALFPLVGSIKEHAIAVMATAKTVRLWIADNKELVIGAFAVGTALTVAGTALVALGILGPTIATGLSIAAGVVATAWSAATAVIAAPFVLLKTVALAALAPIALLKAGLAVLLTPIGAIGLALGGLGALFLTQTEAGRGLAKTVGSAFGEVASEGKVLFAGLKETAISTWAEVGAALKKGDIAGAARAALSGLSTAFGQIAESASNVWDKIGDPLKAAFAAAWEDIKARASTVLAGLGKGLKIGGIALAITTSINPITGPVMAIQSAMAGLGYLFLTQTETGQKWGNAVSEAARGAGAAIKDGVMASLDIVASEGKVAWASIKDTAIGAVGGISSAIKRGDWASAINIAWLAIKAIFAQVVASIAKTWNELTAPAREAFARIKEQVTDLVNDIAEIVAPIVEFFKEAWDDTIADLQGWYDTSIGKIKDLYETATGWFEGLSDEWKDFLVGMAGPVTAAVAGVIAAFDFLKPYWEQLTEGLGDNWGSVFSRIISITKQLFADMISGLLGKAAALASKLAGTKAAKAAGVSGTLTDLAGSLTGQAEELDTYSKSIKDEQKAREKARADEKAAKAAARAEEEAENKSFWDDYAEVATGAVGEALKAEKEAAAAALAAAEAEAKRKVELWEDALAAEEQMGREATADAAARQAGIAANAVQGTFGANLAGAGSAAQQFAIGAKVGVNPLEKKADETNALLSRIEEKIEGPPEIE